MLSWTGSWDDWTVSGVLGCVCVCVVSNSNSVNNWERGWGNKG